MSRTRGRTHAAMRLDLSVGCGRQVARNAHLSSSSWRLLSLLIGLPLTIGVSTDVLEALHNGRDIVVGRAAMRILPQARIIGDGGVCGTEPCWLGKNTRESIDLREPGERQTKVSRDSYAAVLVPGSTQHKTYKGSKGDLIDERILRVIRLLAPDAFFFAAERATQYEVMLAPSVYAPHTLPAGERPERLVIVWRRVGISTFTQLRTAADAIWSAVRAACLIKALRTLEYGKLNAQEAKNGPQRGGL